MNTPPMNIIGSLKAVSEMLAVGMSLAAAATNIPREEKANDPKTIPVTNMMGLAIWLWLSRTAPRAVQSERTIPNAEPASDLPKTMPAVETGAV